MLPGDWDVEAEVVVVGFGAAGACAALEAAAAGRSVLVLDRFGGGGATALSGGVVYAGGGTPPQQAAGVTDTPEAMLGYLRTEVGDAVPAGTLKEFCDGSVAMLAWLEGHGVPFGGSLCPDKTSYPTNRHYLYYSGSELSAAAGDGDAADTDAGDGTAGDGTAGGGGAADGTAGDGTVGGGGAADGTAGGGDAADGTAGDGTAGGGDAGDGDAADTAAGDGVAGDTDAGDAAGTSAPASAPAAPRGHRTRGRGTSGALFYARLAIAVRAAGVRVLTQTAARELVTGPDGRVAGVSCRTLRGAPGWARLAHRLLHRWSVKPYLYVPKAGRILHRPVGWLERRYGRPLRVGAARGVVVAAGGFGANRAMMRAHAPQARGGLPLATPGDDGSGIRLGTGAGAATAFLDRVSVWRFLSPPPALLTGVLVDRAGQRVCDESRYGAALGDAIVRRGGRAWLLADRATLAEARRQVRGSTLWFQRLQAWYLLASAVRAPTVAGVAARAGLDPDGLAATLDAYNAAARDPAARDPAGKPAAARRAQDQPPFTLIDCSVRPRLFYPAPVLTLGGLAVSPESGQVLRPDGTVIAGLYAAGRSAAGLCSRSYVSGLSLADCVFSGRRAGRHAACASAPPPVPTTGPASAAQPPAPTPAAAPTMPTPPSRPQEHH